MEFSILGLWKLARLFQELGPASNDTGESLQLATLLL